MNEIDIIPTVVPASFEDVEAAAARYRSFAHMIHIDIADGIYAPNTTWSAREGEKLPEGMSYEVHLMACDPLERGTVFARAGASRIIAHISAFEDEKAVRQAFTAWKSAGASEVGLALLLATPLAAVEPFVNDCTMAQLMTIASIGVQGIPYEPAARERVAQLHAAHPELLISVDGGVRDSNIADLARAGARRFCVGSALSEADDPKAVYDRLKTLAESAI